jgi:hypothetical protein
MPTQRGSSRLGRRGFLGAAALIAGTLPAISCAPATTYERAATETWRPFDSTASHAATMRELVRYAALAPSSHNTQCWHFRIERDAVAIVPDLARRCPAVDPDDHHLFVSLGCAAENLVLAAEAHGFRATVSFEQTRMGPEVRVALAPARPAESPWYRAIPSRQSTRDMYDGATLSVAELRTLEAAGSSARVRVMLLTARPQMEGVLHYVMSGNIAQTSDRAFMAELAAWIRFDDAEAVSSRDGLSTRTTGNPQIPGWLARPLFSKVYSASSENDTYARAIRSSAGIAVFVGDRADTQHWVDAGRAYERFALQATTMGIRTAMINQPVEVVALRPSFASSLGIAGRRPDLVMRFGRGPVMPRSLRRQVNAVVI